MTIGYRIAERFDPTWHAAWPGYVQWSKLTHLTEVVGLDCSLCPAVVPIESDQDWAHALYAEHLASVLDDWRYAKSRLPADRDIRSVQVLAVLREPELSQMQELGPAGFAFIGFDLIEEATCISALNNCGGFDNAFLPEHLNQYGLVSDLATAQDVRARLLDAYPEEPHADCVIWAIWRQEGA